MNRKFIIASISIFFVLLFPMSLRADDDIKKDDVPAAVHDAFKAAFPKAHKIRYDREDDDGKIIYEITFKEGKRTIQAHYAQDGSLLRLDKHNKDDEDD